MPKHIYLTKYFRNCSRLQFSFKTNSLKNPLIHSRSYASAAGGGGGRPGRPGRPPQKPLPFPKDVGFDTCALSPYIQQLYILQLHRDQVGVPPPGCIVFSPPEIREELRENYNRVGIEVSIKSIQATEIGHTFFKSDRSKRGFAYAPSYAAVLDEERLILIDECDDPRTVFEEFKRKYKGYTIAIMRTPYTHAALSFLNNAHEIFPHWLADNKKTGQYASNVLPKMLPSLLDLSPI